MKCTKWVKSLYYRVHCTSRSRQNNSWSLWAMWCSFGCGHSSSGRFSSRQTVALSVCLCSSLGLCSALVFSVWACSGCSVGRAARRGRWMRQSPPSAVYNFWISPLVIFTYSYVTPYTCMRIVRNKNLFMCTLLFLPHRHKTALCQIRLTEHSLLNYLSSLCPCVTHSSCKPTPLFLILTHFSPQL